MSESMPPIVQRLRWAGDRHSHDRAETERAAMARAGFYLLAVGGLLALVSLALPSEEPRNGAAILATAVCALALSLIPLLAFSRLPVVAFELLCSAGTLLVGSGLYFGGTAGYEFFYFWIALYAAYFLRPARVAGQVAFMLACFWLVEYVGPGPSVSPVRWLLAASTLIVAASLVLLLKGHLVASIERLQALIDASPLASIELDADGRVRGWNGAAEAMFGWRQEEILGRRLPVEAEREQHRLLRDYVMSSSALSDYELTCSRKDASSFSASLYTGPVGDDGPAAGGRIVLVADTSGRKELERRLGHASKMESVGRLAGGIAHDFNNLLLVMRSHAFLLRERLGGTVAPELDQIEQAADDAAQLVRQLLAFSRNQFVQPQVLDANAVLGHVDTMLRPLMYEDVVLVRATSAIPATVLADPTQLELIVVNLALNARDALPNGGTITIASDVVQRGGESRVALRVIDTGTGMDEETRGRIFEPFFTTKEEALGTGLGLFIVRELVEHAGGEIGISSAPGRGTTFTVYLPYVEPSVDDAPAPRLAEGLAEALEHHGYTLITADAASDSQLDPVLLEAFSALGLDSAN